MEAFGAGEPWRWRLSTEIKIDDKEKTLEVKIIPDIEVIRQCAWCRNMLRQDSEAFGLGAKIKPETYLYAYEGKSVLLTIASVVSVMLNCIGMKPTVLAEEK